MIIDYVDDIPLSERDVEQHALELNYLLHLASGLNYLNDEVKKVEADIKERNEKEGRKSTGDTQVIAFNFSYPKTSFIICAFDWFSVTACSYVKVVGWLANGGKPQKKRKRLACDYLERVLPEVSIWRNKIGAHPSLVDSRAEDTLADLDMSVMSMIFLINGTLYAGASLLNKHLEGQITSSRKDMMWSLTNTYEQLSSRYWPAPREASSDGGSPAPQ